MLERFDQQSVPKLGAELLFWGRVSFWIQLVLAVISLFMLACGVILLGQSPGSGGALLFAIAGLIALGVGAYWALCYPRRGRQLMLSDKVARPSRAEIMQLLKRNILTNLLGLGLIIVGAESFAGVLFSKAIKLGVGFNILNTKPGDLIQIVDIFVVLANTHIIAAHGLALAIALWFLNRVAR